MTQNVCLWPNLGKKAFALIISLLAIAISHFIILAGWLRISWNHPKEINSGRKSWPNALCRAREAGGGRRGPKPEPVEPNYAQVKVDDMGYPARGPASDLSQPAHYPTSINRDRSWRHSPPRNYGEMDDDDGVIV